MCWLRWCPVNISGVPISGVPSAGCPSAGRHQQGACAHQWQRYIRTRINHTPRCFTPVGDGAVSHPWGMELNPPQLMNQNQQRLVGIPVCSSQSILFGSQCMHSPRTSIFCSRKFLFHQCQTDDLVFVLTPMNLATHALHAPMQSISFK